MKTEVVDLFDIMMDEADGEKDSSPSEVCSVGDALIKCLNKRGCVDIMHIAELSGVSPKEAVKSLRGVIFQKPEVFRNKDVYDMTVGWVLAAIYLSGNIREKLRCARGKDRLPEIYNIACDKVINSIIFEAMGVEEFKVDEMPAMHHAPNGKEARNYTAEEVYDMIMEKMRCYLEMPMASGWKDSHESWEAAERDRLAQAIWAGIIRNEMESVGKSAGSIPAGLRRHLPETTYSGKIAWEQVLHDFIRFDRSDFDFERPDRRFDGDFILPSFCDEVYGTRVEKIWFVVDTSGSMSGELIAMVYAEIRSAIEQIDTVMGELSFFDCEVTEPRPFSDIDELMAIKPIGGGGTSFEAIFSFMEKHFEEKPRAIIIMTDGYANFPDESAAEDIPVIWIIADSDIEPPWGEYIQINSVW